MVGAYLSDLRRVKGMSEMARKGSWGSEVRRYAQRGEGTLITLHCTVCMLCQDELLYKKLVKRFRYKVVRPNSEGLVHMYHSRFKDWSKSSDVRETDA